MTQKKPKQALILGGAGFIGSNIAQIFLDNSWKVVIIDGLLPHTGGRLKNLSGIRTKIKLYQTSVEKCRDLKKILKASDIIIDSMGFTSHRIGMENPLYDLKLNLLSHIYLIQALKGLVNKKVIYLGSRVQYGIDNSSIISEDAHMVPEDVQGINKLGAEHYLRVYSKVYGFDVISLRVSNCFGKNQKLKGDDIGFIGSIIRDIVVKKTAKIYGPERKRHVLYAHDLARIIFKIYKKFPKGFNSRNVGGQRISMKELAMKIIETTNTGSCQFIKLKNKKDMGGAELSETNLTKLIGSIPRTPINLALKETVSYFKNNL